MIGIVVEADLRTDLMIRPLNKRHSLERVLTSAVESKMAHKVVLAVPELDRSRVKSRMEKGEFARFMSHKGFSVYCGANEDIADRIYNAAGMNCLDLIVRIRGNCPFTQTGLIDEMIMTYLSRGYNGYFTNMSLHESYAKGLNIEIFPWWMLVKIANNPLLTTDDYKDCTAALMKETEPKELKTRYYYLNLPPNKTISMIYKNLMLDEHNHNFLEKIAIEYDKHGDLNKALGVV